MSLGHVYIVLEPVGSARLTFDEVLCYELCVLVTEDMSRSCLDSSRSRRVRTVKVSLTDLL